MADEPRKPERQQIPSPEELEDADRFSQGDVASGDSGGRIRASFRRVGMRLRGGVGKNKTVAKAPRPDLSPPVVDEAVDSATSDVMSLEKPDPMVSSAPTEVEDEPRTRASLVGPVRPTFSACRRHGCAASRSRGVLRTRHRLPQRSLNTVREARGERAAARYGHSLGSFTQRYRDLDSFFDANCLKCGDAITVVVEVPDGWTESAAITSVGGHGGSEGVPLAAAAIFRPSVSVSPESMTNQTRTIESM